VGEEIDRSESLVPFPADEGGSFDFDCTTGTFGSFGKLHKPAGWLVIILGSYDARQKQGKA
ncbi:MAG: hypothetical protein VXX66_08675, partial [Actinomycetota bacterium]|nr:hypothetical protein [Actinomycetota bacterium]